MINLIILLHTLLELNIDLLWLWHLDALLHGSTTLIKELLFEHVFHLLFFLFFLLFLDYWVISVALFLEAFLDLLPAFLHLDLFHFSFVNGFVFFGDFHGQGLLTALFCFLVVHAVHILFLSLLDVLFGSFIFSQVKSTIGKRFLDDLVMVMSHDQGIMEPGVGIV
jgi:hypothetical protein